MSVTSAHAPVPDVVQNPELPSRPTYTEMWAWAELKVPVVSGV